MKKYCLIQKTDPEKYWCFGGGLFIGVYDLLDFDPENAFSMNM